MKKQLSKKLDVQEIKLNKNVITTFDTKQIKGGGIGIPTLTNSSLQCSLSC